MSLPSRLHFGQFGSQMVYVDFHRFLVHSQILDVDGSESDCITLLNVTDAEISYRHVIRGTRQVHARPFCWNARDRLIYLTDETRREISSCFLDDQGSSTIIKPNAFKSDVSTGRISSLAWDAKRECIFYSEFHSEGFTVWRSGTGRWDPTRMWTEATTGTRSVYETGKITICGDSLLVVRRPIGRVEQAVSVWIGGTPKTRRLQTNNWDVLKDSDPLLACVDASAAIDSYQNANVYLLCSPVYSYHDVRYPILVRCSLADEPTSFETLLDYKYDHHSTEPIPINCCCDPVKGHLYVLYGNGFQGGGTLVPLPRRGFKPPVGLEHLVQDFVQTQLCLLTGVFPPALLRLVAQYCVWGYF